MPRRPSAPGFTLIEIIAVLVLLGIVAVTVRSVTTGVETDLVAAREQLILDLRFTQQQAFADLNTAEWQLVPGTSDYSIRRGSDAAILQRSLPAGLQLTAAGPILFNSWGQVVAAGNQQTLTLSKGSTSLTINLFHETGFVQ